VEVDGIDYVDASNVDTDLIGHGYYAETKDLLNDLYYSVRLRLPASLRYLQEVPQPPGRYYRLF
jgi:hypothetical protein